MQKCRYEYRYRENILISVITCIGQVALSITLMLIFNDSRYLGKILGVMDQDIAARITKIMDPEY